MYHCVVGQGPDKYNRTGPGTILPRHAKTQKSIQPGSATACVHFMQYTEEEM